MENFILGLFFSTRRASASGSGAAFIVLYSDYSEYFIVIWLITAIITILFYFINNNNLIKIKIKINTITSIIAGNIFLFCL